MFLCNCYLILNVFITYFEAKFLKYENFFQKSGISFLIEIIKIEKATFPYKTILSEANVKTNGMESTKSTFHKEWSFARNFFNIFKILFQIKNFLWGVDLMYQLRKCPYSHFP